MKESDRSGIREFYDRVYYRGATSPTGGSRHHRRLADRLQVRSGEQVLDVACGLGGWLRTCSSRGAQVAGIDLSAVAIEQARQGFDAAELHVGEAETLPFDDDRFDLVTCLGSLEHFIDPERALREMVRVARPDGRFVLLVPNADFLTRKLGLFGGTYQKDAMEVVRTLEEWDALFKAAGLRVERRWRDLHVLSHSWIFRNGLVAAVPRLLQALALCVWPLRWQYQVYHLCHAAPRT